MWQKICAVAGRGCLWVKERLTYVSPVVSYGAVLANTLRDYLRGWRQCYKSFDNQPRAGNNVEPADMQEVIRRIDGLRQQIETLIRRYES